MQSRAMGRGARVVAVAGFDTGRLTRDPRQVFGAKCVRSKSGDGRHINSGLNPGTWCCPIDAAGRLNRYATLHLPFVWW